MFIPYSSEVDDGRIRMAALSIVVLCILTFLFTWPQQLRIEVDATDAARHAMEHSILQDAASSDSTQQSQDPVAAAERLLRQFQDGSSIHQKNAQHAYDSVYATSPVHRFGFIPAHPTVSGLFTHMFLHAGLLHLLGNLLFFYVCGVAMEKHWGFWRFSAIYLAGGAFAAIFFALFSRLVGGSAPDVPLVGASGAIAATMGGFLAVYAKKKIKILLWVTLRPVRFQMAAKWYLPLWFGIELLQSILYSGGPGGGTAYSAHVGGFLFGFLVGKLIKGESEEFDNRFIQEVQKAEASQAAGQTPLPPRPDILHAWEALEGNHIEEARKLFTRQFDAWNQKGAPAMPELAEHLERIFRTARHLRFEALRYFDWGLSLSRNQYPRPALGCLEMALNITDPPLPASMLQRCRREAAALHEALGTNPARAAELRRLAESPGPG